MRDKLSRFTHQELLDRHIDTFIPATRDPGDTGVNLWPLKRVTYTNEGVWESFTRLQDSFFALFKRSNGYVEKRLSNKMAQIMMDTFLLRRAKGLDVECPQQVVPIHAVPNGKPAASDGIELIPLEEFGDKQDVSENEKLRWVFENMQVDFITPQSAPSAGTWALLQELRSNKQQRQDFYKTMWPKLLTKEDAEKGGKLVDDGKETIKLIDRLLEALPEAV